MTSLATAAVTMEAGAKLSKRDNGLHAHYSSPLSFKGARYVLRPRANPAPRFVRENNAIRVDS